MSVNKEVKQELTDIADQLESELKRIGRWTQEPLPAEAFQNMGAFGENTMSFEQWIQFILIERLREVARGEMQLPKNSMVGTYAMRIFGADPQAQPLHSLLYALDSLVRNTHGEEQISAPIKIKTTNTYVPESPPDVITLGDEKLPQVVYELIKVLPQFEGADLEDQLSTYDIYLNICSAAVRPELSRLLKEAAQQCENATSRERIDKAAKDVLEGKGAGRV